MSYPQTTFQQAKFTKPSPLSIRRQTVAKVTLQTQLKLLKSTGRYDCFQLKWHPIYDDKADWPVPKHLFWDSDVGKWIEGACYFLTQQYDEEIDSAVQELVGMIRSAQQDDGYLNVHYTVVEPKGRWTNLRDMHELYNAGHLIEGALAHYEYYKNTLFLEVMEKYVHLIYTIFGPGSDQKHGYPGHPEIELALFRLYSATGNEEAYKLACYFLEERGNAKGQDGRHYYDVEAEARGDSPYKRPNPYPVAGEHWYNQSQAPILEQQSVEGHSVRAMYLLTAVADMVCLNSSPASKRQHKHPNSAEWLNSAKVLWNNMVDKKMYLTGGLGAHFQWEGFGRDYFLPQSTDEGGCYSETCASIAAMMFAERLLNVDLDARYADMMELSLYNVVMTAMSVEGKAFTYENQLASCEQAHSKREGWFEVACCPPNVTRLFGSLAGYLWDFDGSTVSGKATASINVHLYASAKLEFQVDGATASLEQTSKWPLDGEVAFHLSVPSDLETTVRLRIPLWCNGAFTLSPPLPDARLEKSYLTLPPAYLAQNPSFTLTIHNFGPRFIAPHPYTNQHTLTLARGPIVYCVEDADNEWEENHFRDIMISADAEVTEEKRTMEGSSGEEYVALRTVGEVRDMGEWQKRAEGTSPGVVVGGGEKKGKVNGVNGVNGAGSSKERELVFIPYYYRANRGGRGQMRVGLLRA